MFWDKRKSVTLADLCAPKRRKNAICTMFHQATPGTTYWRCALPAKYMPGNLLPANQLALMKHPDGHFEWENFDVPAIIQFPGDQATAVAAMIAEGERRKLFVEVDDTYIDGRDHLWHARAGWGATIGSTPHTVQGHRWIVEHAHGVIVTTPALAEQYAELNPNVYICRNSIDPDDWPRLEKPDDGVFRIGWYASASHDRDQEVCRSAIAWAARQPGVQVVNIGLNPTGWNFPRVQIGWHDDFLELRRTLMALDVGIAPLIGTPTAKYRSDVKALEYAMAGAMPVLQSMPPYADWPALPFAFVPATKDEWREALQWCVRNRDEVRERGMAAREYVLGERTMAHEIERWREALEY